MLWSASPRETNRDVSPVTDCRAIPYKVPFSLKSMGSHCPIASPTQKALVYHSPLSLRAPSVKMGFVRSVRGGRFSSFHFQELDLLVGSTQVHPIPFTELHALAGRQAIPESPGSRAAFVPRARARARSSLRTSEPGQSSGWQSGGAATEAGSKVCTPRDSPVPCT